jgi:hypothetical protein
MMTISLSKKGVRTITAATLLHMFSLAAVAQETEFSQAETLLWMTDQLKMIERPVQLNYSFERTGTFEPGFTDKVTFTIRSVKDDGTKAASVDFFSGERRFEVPPVESTSVNPILKIYLQGDVYEMNRLTDRTANRENAGVISSVESNSRWLTVQMWRQQPSRLTARRCRQPVFLSVLT